MRLLNAKSLELVKFIGDNIPAYAILSHTWGKDEVTFSDFKSRSCKRQQGYKKIRYTLDQALKDGLQWAWVDTCCIDKSSSAELSEAINSMFRWYYDAEVCYAYLEDVHWKKGACALVLEESRWISRGWTLQELIAPKRVLFFDSNWTSINERERIAHELATITGIAESILRSDHGHIDSFWRDLHKYSVAQRMSWAARRETTRLEDRAYSLLGLFQVNMPLLYGEGLMAFQRLQEEILKARQDLSIFAWPTDTSLYASRISEFFATSPEFFENSGNIILTGGSQDSFLEGEATLTNASLRVIAKIFPVDHTTITTQYRGGVAMILNCRLKDDITTVIGLELNLGPTHGSLEQAMAAETMECIGPDNEGNRLLLIDALSAASSSKVKSVALRKDSALDNWSEIGNVAWPAYGSCRIVWLRFLGATLKEQSGRLQLTPERYWNSKNITFDLQGARLANRNNGPVHASIIFHHQQMGKIIIHIFERVVGELVNAESSRHILRLKNGETMNTELLMVTLSAERVAILNLSTQGEKDEKDLHHMAVSSVEKH